VQCLLDKPVTSTSGKHYAKICNLINSNQVQGNIYRVLHGLPNMCSAKQALEHTLDEASSACTRFSTNSWITCQPKNKHKCNAHMIYHEHMMHVSTSLMYSMLKHATGLLLLADGRQKQSLTKLG
jgi:hypothetical protein